MKILNAADRVWLFDYDMTLYSERAVLDSLDRRISLFVQKMLDISLEKASEIRREYLHTFGTTLAGLVALHGVRPDDYFDFIHEPSTLVYPEFSFEKLQMLDSILGPKYVFTNGRSDWSRKGISLMKISGCFRRVIGLEDLGWKGKPSASAYEKMEEVLFSDGAICRGESPEKIILLDDSLKNLKPACDRGWTTVWVHPESDADSSFVSGRISNLFELCEILEPAIKLSLRHA